MRCLPHAAAALALLTVSFTPAQDLRARPKATDPRTLDAKLAAMQGLWRLTALDTPKLPRDRRDQAGYLLVSGTCFSLEVHWGWLGPDGKNAAQKDFQSGTHRFEFDQAGNLEARSLIGAAFMQSGLMQWEEPGKVRRYKVDHLAQAMRWTNDDGAVFTFEQVPMAKSARTDIFGRPIPEKAPEKAPDPGGDKPPPK